MLKLAKILHVVECKAKIVFYIYMENTYAGNRENKNSSYFKLCC